MSESRDGTGYQRQQSGRILQALISALNNLADKEGKLDTSETLDAVGKLAGILIGKARHRDGEGCSEAW